MARGPMLDAPFSPDAAARLQRGDLRNIQRAVCASCAYEWTAPAIGKCPACKADGAVVKEQLELGIRRV